MRFSALFAVCMSALLAACDGASNSPKYSEPVAFRLAVKGMHCEGCESAICDKVGKIAGVTACKASHVAEEVEVIAPQEQKDAIAAAIKKLGYKLEE
jgi:copper chaperone CopZ